MWVTKKLNDNFNKLSNHIHKWVDTKIIIIPIVLIMILIYIIILYVELLLGLIIYRHKTNVQNFNDEQRKWLNKTIGKGQWKSMIYDFPGSECTFRSSDEIRFLTKKSAMHFKLAWK